MPARDLSYFINLYGDGKKSAHSPSEASYTHYRDQHPVENSDLQPWIESHRILSNSSEATCCNGKGFDFCQEEDLKRVLKYLPRGVLFDFDSFKRAVRMKQNVENFQGSKSTKRDRPYEKYTIEVQVAGSIVMKNQFTTHEAFGLNPYCEDLLKIPEIFDQNLSKLFHHRATGFESSSLKLTEFHFTKADKLKSGEIEAKTKKEIIQLIFELGSCEDHEYFENLKDLAKESKKKQFLIDLYHEVIDDQLQTELEIDDQIEID